MSAASWVFGYGSLVSPTSMARTIGRIVEPDDVTVAHLDGYGRRWNYGSMHRLGNWSHEGRSVSRGLIVALGLERSAAESSNGVAIRVTPDELDRLDLRERDYDRTDVTDLIRSEGSPIDGPVVTYVPRPSAVARYECGRDEGRAAIERRYWDLVHAAFAEFGTPHSELFATTPPPDVPVADITFG